MRRFFFKLALIGSMGITSTASAQFKLPNLGGNGGGLPKPPANNGANLFKPNPGINLGGGKKPSGGLNLPKPTFPNTIVNKPTFPSLGNNSLPKPSLGNLGGNKPLIPNLGGIKPNVPNLGNLGGNKPSIPNLGNSKPNLNNLLNGKPNGDKPNLANLLNGIKPNGNGTANNGGKPNLANLLNGIKPNGNGTANNGGKPNLANLLNGIKPNGNGTANNGGKPNLANLLNGIKPNGNGTANNGGKPNLANLLNGGKGGVAKFSLTGPTNNIIGGLIGGNAVDPFTKTILGKAGAGEQLTDAEREILKAQMLSNNGLNASQKGALAEILQEDLKEKQGMLGGGGNGLLGLLNGGGNGGGGNGGGGLLNLVPVVPQPQIIQPVVIEPQPTIIYQPSSGSDIQTTGGAETTQEWGMQITEMAAQGPAVDANLKVGHVIVAVANQRIQSFEELKAALAAANGEVEVIVFDPESNTLAKTVITPNQGRIGVATEPVVIE